MVSLISFLRVHTVYGYLSLRAVASAEESAQIALAFVAQPLIWVLVPAAAKQGNFSQMFN